MDYVKTPLTEVLSVKSAVSLHYFPYTKDFYFKGESHDFWELIIVDSGEVTVTDGNDTHILKQGDAFLHIPGVYHSIWANNVFSNIIIFSFDSDCSDLYRCRGKATVTNEIKYFAGFLLSEGKKSLALPLDKVFQNKLEFKEDYPYGATQLIKNTLESILILMVRGDTDFNHKTSTNKILVDKILMLLKKNVAKKITIDEISASVGYCPTYVKRVFKSETQDSIINYFIKLKIAAAKKMLSENEMSVTEISEALGFESVQYFSSQFKKRVNMTPSEYALSIDGILT